MSPAMLDGYLLYMKTIMLAVAVAALSFSCVATDTGDVPASSGAAGSAARGAAGAASPRPIDYATLKAALEASGSAVLLLDVRTKEEFDSGHIPGAALAPYDTLQAAFAEPDKNRPIVVYCRSGRRSAIAAETLARMGYTDISDFGGVDRWKGDLRR